MKSQVLHTVHTGVIFLVGLGEVLHLMPRKAAMKDQACSFSSHLLHSAN